jgi:SPP1 gp7 family putative phage head morphogenesis protein
MEWLLNPVPNEEAAAFIRDKAVVTRKVFAGMLPEIRARAFIISGVESLDVVQGVRDRIATLPEGGDWDTLKKEILTDISPWLVTSDDPEENAKQLLSANRRAELLLRIHGMQAYSAANYRALDEQRDIFEYWKYQSMDDGRVRHTHGDLDGAIIRNGSTFWLEHFPPWEFGCRCNAVAMLADEVDEIRTKEQSLPPESRKVIDGHRLKLLEEQGVLDNGLNKRIDVRSPREKEGDAAYSFEPGSLKMPLEMLRSRYDDETWAEFERLMKSEEQAPGQTIWQWLGGENQPVSAPVPTPKPALTSAAGKPLSASITIESKMTKAEKAKATTAFAAIDKVHGDGDPGSLTVSHKLMKRSDGTYWGGLATLGFRKKGVGALFHIAHEVGHWVDHRCLASATKFASDEAANPNSPLHDWWKAIQDSLAVKDIVNAQPISLRAAQYKAYQLQARELWARSYSQFIAMESREPAMMTWLDNVRKGATGYSSNSQWSDEDFAPIADAFKKLFTSLNWISP